MFFLPMKELYDKISVKNFANPNYCSNFAADLVRRGSKKRQHEACPPRGKTRFTNN